VCGKLCCTEAGTTCAVFILAHDSLCKKFQA